MNEAQLKAVAQAKAAVSAALTDYVRNPTHENQKVYARACNLLYSAIYWPRDTVRTDIEYKRMEDHLPEDEDED